MRVEAIPVRHGYTKILALALLAVALLAVAPEEATRPSAAVERPNILFVVADDMRADDLRFTPRVKALLGEDGRTFGRAYVTTSSCCPSRSTMLTGRYAHNHKVFSNVPPLGGFGRFRRLGRESSTVAVALDDAGYRTALIGKYLNGYRDVSHVPPGWDEWFANAGTVDEGRISDNGEPFERNEKTHHDDLLSRRAEDFVRGSRRPFFLYLSTNAPHGTSPDFAPRHAERFQDLTMPRTQPYDEADVSDKPAWVAGKGRLKAREEAGLQGGYRDRARSLLAVDEAVGRLVEILRGQGELQNTYLVFTSDNGYHMGEHRLRPGKTSAYEEDIRVPLIVKGPGVKAGREGRISLNTDLASTFAAWAGARMDDTDGRPLTPLLSGEPAPWRSGFLVEKIGSGSKYAYRALRTRAHLYVEYENGDRELYNMARNPNQTRNTHQEADAGLLAEFRDRLDALEDCAGRGCRKAENSLGE
jgi:N-acetylglucosamine-6-sulfatase